MTAGTLKPCPCHLFQFQNEMDLHLLLSYCPDVDLRRAFFAGDGGLLPSQGCRELSSPMSAVSHTPSTMRHAPAR